MTAPRNGFGAHQDETFTVCERDASIQTVLERGGLHVVRIAAEAEIPPASVRGVPACAAAAAQCRHVTVLNARACQRRRQVLLSELGIVTRARHRPHVDKAL